MKKLIFFILSSLFLFSGCKKEKDIVKASFDVELSSLDAACGLPLIHFKEEDLPALGRITVATMA